MFCVGPWEFLRQFYVDPRAHANFYWVLVTRLLGNMGIWSVFTFLLFYFKDVIGVAEPAQRAAGAARYRCRLAVPASIIGVRLAAHYGLVRITQITSWIMAVCCISLRADRILPKSCADRSVILIYAAAFGAYQAVDSALALKVLPSAEAAGKDMGSGASQRRCCRSRAGSHGRDDIGGEGILRRSHCIRDSIRDWSALAHALGGSRHPRAGDGPCRKSNSNMLMV